MKHLRNTPMNAMNTLSTAGPCSWRFNFTTSRSHSLHQF